MAQATAAIVKIPTESPQLAPGKPPARPKRQAKPGAQPARAKLIAGGSERAATRGGGEVITLECGITVYPARSEEGRWRAVWYEDGRREQCEAPSEEKLAAKLDKVRIRLEADAPKMRQPGAALIAHYLDPRPAARRQAVVTQARSYPGAAVPEVRRSSDRHGYLPGHQGQPHAGDRQRRADGRGGRPGPRDGLRDRHGGHRRRVPGELPAGEGPLAGGRPPASRAHGQHCGRVSPVG
jgi:hypothetical protein